MTDFTCAKCGDEYHLPLGNDPTKYCHDCAHERVAELEQALALRGEPVASRTELEIIAKNIDDIAEDLHDQDFKHYPSTLAKAALLLRTLAAPLYAAPISGERAPFQLRVEPWMQACFGEEISNDKTERNHRFVEEALELAQACGCTASEAHQLVEYVFGRPAGERVQEVGGVMVTLAALCLAHGLDMHGAGETELERVWQKIDKIRAKQAAKPKHSPLPEAAAVSGERVREALEELLAAEADLDKGTDSTKVRRLKVAQNAAREALALPLAAQPETAGLALLYNVWCMHSQEQDDEWFYQWRQLMQAIELELSRSKYGPSLSAPVNAAQPEGK